MPRKNNGKQRKGKFVRLNMEELSIISTFDAFFFFFLVNRCRQFMIKRPPIFILYSKRERKKKHSLRSQNDSVCTKPYRRFDTKDDRNTKALQEIRCTSTNRLGPADCQNSCGDTRDDGSRLALVHWSPPSLL